MCLPKAPAALWTQPSSVRASTAGVPLWWATSTPAARCLVAGQPTSTAKSSPTYSTKEALTDPSTPSFVHRSVVFADTIDWALATPAASRFLRARFGEDIGSDHLPILVSFAVETPATTRVSAAVRWRTTKVPDWRPFELAAERELLQSGLLDEPAPATPAAVDAAATRLEEALFSAADATLTRSRPVADNMHLPFPWWAVLLVRLRRRLRRRLADHHLPDVLRNELRHRLRHLRTVVQRELEAHRRARLEEKARFFAAGPRRQGLEFWTAVRRWFRSSNAGTVPLTTADGDMAVTPPERAEVFATHLRRALGGANDPAFDEAFRIATEAAVESDTSIRPLSCATEAAAPPAGDPTCPVSAGEVQAQINRLKSGKAPGLDGLSPDILRRCPRLASVLAGIFTGSLAVGYYPERWRQSAVRMLPKPGKALTSPADYRPIALCSCLGKLLERLFARRLLAEVQRRRLLPSEQSAFLPGRDTTEQLVLLIQRIHQSLNAGQVTTLIALDANKAYDSVWHAGLLHSLRERQFSAPTRRWIAAFLRRRTAAVLEDGHLSARFPVAAGVPQGSPLSPLLYILYTAEMPLPRGPQCGASVYADDVALYASGPSPSAALQRLRPTLHRAVRWGRRWRIAFNPAKTQLGFFSRRSHWPLDQLAPPHLMGVEQQWSRTVDLLGVRLDRRLSLNAHVRRLQEKLGPRILDLRRWTWAYRSVPGWVGVLLFSTLLRPAYTYAAPALQAACPSARERLRRIERRGLRAAQRLGLDCPISVLRARARVQPLDDHLADLGGRFLLRAVDTGYRRLLSAYNSWAAQSWGVARRDTLLNRLFANLPEADRHRLRQELFRLGIFPGGADISHRRGRNRRTLGPGGADPELWGISPFDPP